MIVDALGIDAVDRRAAWAGLDTFQVIAEEPVDNEATAVGSPFRASGRLAALRRPIRPVIPGCVVGELPQA